MPNTKDALVSQQHHKLLVLGLGGAGKTTQIRTLPGRKFAYLFDPNAKLSLQGADIDYEELLPDVLEMDSTLKKFNKTGVSDKAPDSKREPSVYMRWGADLNAKATSGFFKDYDWLCFDSLTLLASAVMDRQMYINGRYGGIEDLGDYRIAGSKIADVFRSICSLPMNIYATGHLTSFQDEKTKKIETQIQLPGKARIMLPLLFSNIWEARASTDEKTGYVLLTKPEARGFQSIRTTIPGLPSPVDVTIMNFSKAEDWGIGKILRDAKPRNGQPAAVPTTPKPVAVTGVATGQPTNA